MGRRSKSQIFCCYCLRFRVFFVYLLPDLCCHCVQHVGGDLQCMFIGIGMNFHKSDVPLLMVQGKMTSKSKNNLISV